MPRKTPRELPPREPPYEEEISEEEMEEELAPNELPPLPPTQPYPQPRGRPPIRRAPPQPPQPRYTGFVQQAAEGIVDSETKEVIATDMWAALANIMERLERIESSIGSMLGE